MSDAAPDEGLPDLELVEQTYEPLLPLAQLRPHPKNANVGDEDVLDESLSATGFYGALLVQPPEGRRKNYRILAGHTRSRRAQARGADSLPCLVLHGLSDKDAARIVAVDNRSTRRGYDDAERLAELLSIMDGDLAGSGFTEADEEALREQLAAAAAGGPGGGGGGGAPGSPPGSGALAARFVVPPFSVLDQRAGYWQERKRAWLELGIRSELGRDGNLLGYSDAVLASEQGEDPYGQPTPPAWRIGPYEGGDAWSGAGTSIFDPVICELAYRWYSPAGGRVLDPFAGGSVRGIVAAMLGREYHGVDLRPEQLDHNREQAAEIVPDDQPEPEWWEGDSAELLAEWRESPTTEPPFDLLFSCPPYADLEVYSDNPADLSTLDWPAFLDSYQRVIADASELMADNAFAVWVVSEVRAPDGSYRGLVPETIRAFQAADWEFYNEAALVSPTGSLALRAGRIFGALRKLGRCHQNVLVFLRGSAEEAVARCGELEATELAWLDAVDADEEEAPGA